MIAKRTRRALLLCLTPAVLALTAAGAGTASADSLSVVNQTPIKIPEKGTATPYPSTVDVQGLPGRVTDVFVSLKGFSHEFPSDVDVLLVSPSGRASVVMSDICGGTTITGRSWIFNQSFSDPMNGVCEGSAYKPTDGGGVEGWPFVFGSHFPQMDRFIGDEPNGTWSLYVQDDANGDDGRIANGWALTVESKPVVASIPGPAGIGEADPYPLTQTVSGRVGVISDIDVRLTGVYLERPRDLNLVLFGPDGQNVELMSDACGTARIKNADWLWDDETGQLMTANSTCASGAWWPSGYDPPETLPAPAPPKPYGSFMSHMDYTKPNGEWRLYVYDDLAFNDSGFLTQNFQLDIETRPGAGVGFLDQTIELDEGTAGEVELFRSSGGRGLGKGSVTVTSSPLSATSATDFKPFAAQVEFQSTDTTQKILLQALADELPEDVETFQLTIGGGDGDAQPAQEKTAVVTIRDQTPDPVEQPGADPGPGPGAGPEPSGSVDQPGVVVTTPDRTAPVIGSVRIAKRARALLYSLSETAAVTVQVQRRSGRRRFRTVATLRAAGRDGLNRIALGRRARRRGAYRVRITAVDAAGNRSAQRTRAFRVGR